MTSKIIEPVEVVCQGMVFRKIDNRFEILLCQRGEAARSEIGKWCIPGGHLEEHEMYEDCVSREVMEETNVDIKQELWHEVNRFHPDEAPSMLCVNFAVIVDDDTALALSPSNVNVPDEISAVEFFDVDKIIDEDLAFDKENIMNLIRSGLSIILNHA